MCTIFVITILSPSNKPFNYTRKGKDATNDVDKVFKYLCSMENDVIRPRTISIRGRNVTFRKTCGQVLDSTFEELCDRVRGLLYYYYLYSMLIRTICNISIDPHVASRSKRLFAVESNFPYSHNKGHASVEPTT